MLKNRNTANIPIITNLVAAGDPSRKAQIKQQMMDSSSHLAELNQRIDEIENAIGQNKTKPVSRAFAIRRESNKSTKARTPFMSDSDIQKIR